MRSGSPLSGDEERQAELVGDENLSGVVVRKTSTYEEFAAANRVVMEAFDFPDAMRSRGCGRVADAMGGVHDTLEPGPAVHSLDSTGASWEQGSQSSERRV